jgi:hypothetical protein
MLPPSLHDNAELKRRHVNVILHIYNCDDDDDDDDDGVYNNNNNLLQISTPLISKPATGHNSEQVLSTSHLFNSFLSG